MPLSLHCISSAIDSKASEDIKEKGEQKINYVNSFAETNPKIQKKKRLGPDPVGMTYMFEEHREIQCAVVLYIFFN